MVDALYIANFYYLCLKHIHQGLQHLTYDLSLDFKKESPMTTFSRVRERKQRNRSRLNKHHSRNYMQLQGHTRICIASLVPLLLTSQLDQSLCCPITNQSKNLWSNHVLAAPFPFGIYYSLPLNLGKFTDSLR